MAANLHRKHLHFQMYFLELNLVFTFFLSFSSWGDFNINHHWCKCWLGAEQVTSHYQNQCSFSYLTLLCTRLLEAFMHQAHMF